MTPSAQEPLTALALRARSDSPAAPVAFGELYARALTYPPARHGVNVRLRPFGLLDLADDVLSEALLKALGAYCFQSSRSFEAYLVVKAKQTAHQYIADASGVSRDHVDRWWRIRQEADALEASTGGHPTAEEVQAVLRAQGLSWPLDHIVWVLEETAPRRSLDDALHPIDPLDDAPLPDASAEIVRFDVARALNVALEHGLVRFVVTKLLDFFEEVSVSALEKELREASPHSPEPVPWAALAAGLEDMGVRGLPRQWADVVAHFLSPKEGGTIGERAIRKDVARACAVLQDALRLRGGARPGPQRPPVRGRALQRTGLRGTAGAALNP